MMLSTAHAREVLQQAGIRLTPQRMMIIEALVDNRTHPTVEQIFSVVWQRYPAVSLATVYQTVSLLARHGLIRELRGGKDGLRCDPDTSAHSHAYCLTCGKILDVEMPALPAWDAYPPAGFHPTEIEVSLYGHCEQCDQQRQEDQQATAHLN